MGPFNLFLCLSSRKLVQSEKTHLRKTNRKCVSCRSFPIMSNSSCETWTLQHYWLLSVSLKHLVNCSNVMQDKELYSQNYFGKTTNPSTYTRSSTSMRKKKEMTRETASIALLTSSLPLERDKSTMTRIISTMISTRPKTLQIRRLLYHTNSLKSTFIGLYRSYHFYWIL